MTIQDVFKKPALDFISYLKRVRAKDFLSIETARELDAYDPLRRIPELFELGSIIPFAGHSLGIVLKKVRQKYNETLDIQKNLPPHDGHFANTHPDGKNSANWISCDRYKPGLVAAQKILGFEHLDEFTFTQSGLSTNLGILVSSFYRPRRKDWNDPEGRKKILMLSGEFFSDGAIGHSVLVSKMNDAEIIENPANFICKIEPNPKTELYETDTIIRMIRENASQLQLICLSYVVAHTGQMIDLPRVFAVVGDLIEKNKINVILDLAHTVGNRPIDLKSMPITAAVGCGYKHLCGPAGSSFGIYVSRKADLKTYPPIFQGWTAADPNRVFAHINRFNPDIMIQKQGALAFNASNQSPIALIPVQTTLASFHKIGFDQLFERSERLTAYLIEQIQHRLKDKVDIITPLDPNQRTAMICIRPKENIDLNKLELDLKKLGMEIDVRPPNLIRITPHYGYSNFEKVYSLVQNLEQILKPIVRLGFFENAGAIDKKVADEKSFCIPSKL